MAFATWDSSYSVNVSKCDEDHKKLFALLNTLHDAMKAGKASDVIQQVVKELADYTKYHFSQEEMLLRQTNYPNLLPHQLQHQEFIKKVEEFQSELKAGNMAQGISVTDFVQKWLTDHIKGMDREYSAHLNAKGIS